MESSVLQCVAVCDAVRVAVRVAVRCVCCNVLQRTSDRVFLS